MGAKGSVTGLGVQKRRGREREPASRVLGLLDNEGGVRPRLAMGRIRKLWVAGTSKVGGESVGEGNDACAASG